MLCPKGKDYPKQPKAKTCFIDPLFLTQMELKVVKWLKAKKEQESHQHQSMRYYAQYSFLNKSESFQSQRKGSYTINVMNNQHLKQSPCFKFSDNTYPAPTQIQLYMIFTPTPSHTPLFSSFEQSKIEPIPNSATVEFQGQRRTILQIKRQTNQSDGSNMNGQVENQMQANCQIKEGFNNMENQHQDSEIFTLSQQTQYISNLHSQIFNPHKSSDSSLKNKQNIFSFGNTKKQQNSTNLQSSIFNKPLRYHNEVTENNGSNFKRLSAGSNLIEGNTQGKTNKGIDDEKQKIVKKKIEKRKKDTRKVLLDQDDSDQENQQKELNHATKNNLETMMNLPLGSGINQQNITASQNVQYEQQGTLLPVHQPSSHPFTDHQLIARPLTDNKVVEPVQGQSKKLLDSLITKYNSQNIRNDPMSKQNQLKNQNHIDSQLLNTHSQQRDNNLNSNNLQGLIPAHETANPHHQYLGTHQLVDNGKRKQNISSIYNAELLTNRDDLYNIQSNKEPEKVSVYKNALQIGSGYHLGVSNYNMCLQQFLNLTSQEMTLLTLHYHNKIQSPLQANHLPSNFHRRTPERNPMLSTSISDDISCDKLNVLVKELQWLIMHKPVSQSHLQQQETSSFNQQQQQNPTKNDQFNQSIMQKLFMHKNTPQNNNDQQTHQSAYSNKQLYQSVSLQLDSHLNFSLFLQLIKRFHKDTIQQLKQCSYHLCLAQDSTLNQFSQITNGNLKQRMDKLHQHIMDELSQITPIIQKHKHPHIQSVSQINPNSLTHNQQGIYNLIANYSTNWNAYANDPLAKYYNHAGMFMSMLRQYLSIQHLNCSHQPISQISMSKDSQQNQPNNTTQPQSIKQHCQNEEMTVTKLSDQLYLLEGIIMQLEQKITTMICQMAGKEYSTRGNTKQNWNNSQTLYSQSIGQDDQPFKIGFYNELLWDQTGNMNYQLLNPGNYISSDRQRYTSPLNLQDLIYTSSNSLPSELRSSVQEIQSIEKMILKYERKGKDEFGYQQVEYIIQKKTVHLETNQHTTLENQPKTIIPTNQYNDSSLQSHHNRKNQLLQFIQNSTKTQMLDQSSTQLTTQTIHSILTALSNIESTVEFMQAQLMNTI